VGIETDCDLDSMFCVDEFGSSATYTAPGGVAVSCDAHLRLGVAMVDTTGAVVDTADVIYLRQDQVANPVRDAAIVIGGVTYRVNEILPRRDGSVVGVSVRTD
jgi:hypothetical protein